MKILAFQQTLRAAVLGPEAFSCSMAFWPSIIPKSALCQMHASFFYLGGLMPIGLT